MKYTSTAIKRCSMDHQERRHNHKWKELEHVVYMACVGVYTLHKTISFNCRTVGVALSNAWDSGGHYWPIVKEAKIGLITLLLLCQSSIDALCILFCSHLEAFSFPFHFWKNMYLNIHLKSCFVLQWLLHMGNETSIDNWVLISMK